MKKLLPLIVAFAGLLVVSAATQAATIISVQYVTPTSTQIGTNSAGVDLASGWNEDVNAAAISSLLDSNGNATGIGLTTTENYGSHVFAQQYAFSAGAAGDKALFNAGALSNNAPQVVTFTLTGLNAADTYTLDTYSMSNTASRVNGSINVSATNGTSFYMINPSSSYSTYTQGTATTTATAATGDYFEFTGITGVTSLTYTLTNQGGAFADLPGFQLVDTTSGTPEPSTIALFAMAVTGLTFQLGRKRRSTV